MAAGFQSLVDGACGGANPLMRLTTHFTEDKSKSEFASRTNQKQFDALQNRQRNTFKSSDHDLVNEYLSNYPSNTSAPINSFNMKELLKNVQPQHTEKDWSHEFLHTHYMPPKSTTSSQYQSPPNQSFQPQNQSSEVQWASEYLDQFDQQIQSNDQSQRAAKELHDVLDQDIKFSKSDFKSFLKNMENSTGDDSKWADEFLSTQSRSKTSDWSTEFSDLTDSDFDSYFKDEKNKVLGSDTTYKSDFWKNFEDQWKSADPTNQGEFHHSLADEFSSLEEDGATFAEYKFQEDNPLKDLEDCLETGKLKLSEGDLPSAVLLFEAAAQQQPENPEVWFLLGTSQAKNEQDPAAISALMKSITLDPKNLDAIQALAASLTNESHQAQACHALKDWLQSNPKYSHLDPGSTGLECLKRTYTSSFMTREQHQETMDLFLKAARMNHLSGQVDSDVQSGLGVLFNLSGDFDKAADCFKAALSVKPDDLLLWNRLGATLANGNRSEEAISAYHEALRLYPGFVRSRYNLGISCLNLKAYQEAVEHFLTALNFQAAGRGPEGSGGSMSESIWGSLRLGISLLGRPDLYRHVEARNLDTINAEFKINVGQ